MANAADQPDPRINVPPQGTVQPGAGKVERTLLPNNGAVDTRMPELVGVVTGRIEVSTAPLTNIKV